MSIRWKVDRTLLKAPFAEDVDTLLMQDPASWVVTYGFRTRDEQAALYALWLKWLEDHPGADPKDGPRAAPPGMSAHEAGLAVDVTLVNNGKDDWNYKGADWLRLVAAVEAHPRLHSLTGIGDTDHIEAVHWKDIASAS